MLILEEEERERKALVYFNLCCLLSVLTRASTMKINEIFCFSIIKECVWCFDLKRQITEIAFENSFRPGYNFSFCTSLCFISSMPSPSFDCLHVALLILLYWSNIVWTFLLLFPPLHLALSPFIGSSAIVVLVIAWLAGFVLMVASYRMEYKKLLCNKSSVGACVYLYEFNSELIFQFSLDCRLLIWKFSSDLCCWQHKRGNENFITFSPK